MKLNFKILLFCFTIAISSFSQNLERKIIIQNGNYHYVTVDDNIQLATLYKGSLNKPLKEGRAYAVPAGRGISAETNPLAWDIDADNQMYAINFMDHNLNDRNESLKKIPIANLKEWGTSVQIEEIIMESIDHYNFVLNEPYLFIKKRSNYLSHFYFDAITFKNDYWMVTTNNQEITIWQYTKDEWKHSAVKKFPVTGPFSLLKNNKELLLITNKGAIYEINLSKFNQIQQQNTALELTSVILVENRDNNTNYYIKNNQINLEKSMNEIIETAGVILIKN